MDTGLGSLPKFDFTQRRLNQLTQMEGYKNMSDEERVIVDDEYVINELESLSSLFVEWDESWVDDYFGLSISTIIDPLSDQFIVSSSLLGLKAEDKTEAHAMLTCLCVKYLVCRHRLSFARSRLGLRDNPLDAELCEVYEEKLREMYEVIDRKMYDVIKRGIRDFPPGKRCRPQWASKYPRWVVNMSYKVWRYWTFRFGWPGLMSKVRNVIWRYKIRYARPGSISSDYRTWREI